MVYLALLTAAVAGPVSARQAFPGIPDTILGVNQYSVGPPESEGKGWPLNNVDVERLKAVGVNTVRFPLYPREIGLDGKALFIWKTGDVFDEGAANKMPVDWRSLDAVLDKLAEQKLTPYICPHSDPLRLWDTAHIPEDAERVFWFTRLIVKHVHEKYGDNAIYGYYENHPWSSYRHHLSTRFPPEWRRMIGKMYDGDIQSLNRNWKSSYKSFDDVPIPELWGKDSVFDDMTKEFMVNTYSRIPDSAFASRGTYDLRLAIDLLARERLVKWREELRSVSPGAMWAGGCILSPLKNLFDAGTLNLPSCTTSIRTLAQTGDVVTVDDYGTNLEIATAYRTVAKIAATETKKFLVAEVSAVDPAAFRNLANVGGPTRGSVAWCGKEDTYGFMKWDGTPREANIKAFGELGSAYVSQPGKYSKYTPGRVHIYFPEETYCYSLLRRTHMEAYLQVCRELPPTDIEPVLTGELAGLPKDAQVFVLEKYLPRKAIDILNSLGKRVICPHQYFVDENGVKAPRKYVPKDFLAELNAAKDGPKLMEAFLRVEEKENNLARAEDGAIAKTSSRLDETPVPAGGRKTGMESMIDGDFFSMTIYSDEKQQEDADIILPQVKDVYGAYVQMWGTPADLIDPLMNASRSPERVRVTVSEDGVTWKEVAKIDNVDTDRVHIRFAETKAKYIHFDFGRNDVGKGLRITGIGVLGRS